MDWSLWHNQMVCSLARPNPMWFFTMGYCEGACVLFKTAKLTQTEIKIQATFDDINESKPLLLKICDSVLIRCMKSIDNNGGHFEHLP